MGNRPNFTPQIFLGLAQPLLYSTLPCYWEMEHDTPHHTNPTSSSNRLSLTAPPHLFLTTLNTEKYCDKSVCLSVCLSACLSVRSRISETAWPNFTKCLCTLNVAMASRFCSGGAAIRYALPVFRMTSRFHIIGPYTVRQVYSSAATDHDTHNGRDSNRILLSTIQTGAESRKKIFGGLATHDLGGNNG